MARFPDIEDAPLAPEAQRVFEEIAQGPRGRVEGPLRIWLHSPLLASASQALGAYCRYRTALEPRISELVILTIAAYWKAGFEWHVHLPIAIASGVDAQAASAIKSGETPKFRQEEDAIAYATTRSLIVDRELPTDLFTRAHAAFGTRGVVDLVGIVGYYSYISMTIVAFEVDTPGGDPFARNCQID